MSLECSVTFCTIHANVNDAYPFCFFCFFYLFFPLHGNVLWCSVSFRLLRSVAMFLQPALIVSRWQVQPSTHQGDVFCSLSLFTSHTPWKTADNGSSCNPSSGNFFLFKTSFRYLNKMLLLIIHISNFNIMIFFFIRYSYRLVLFLFFSILWSAAGNVHSNQF